MFLQSKSLTLQIKDIGNYMLSKYLNPDTKAALKRLIDESDNIMVVCHRGPDGDAVGSSLGLACAMSKIGKNVNVVAPNKIPENYESMSNIRSFLSFEENQEEVVKKAKNVDLFFFLDFNDIKRIGLMANLIKGVNAKMVQIDHHENPTLKVDVCISDPKCSSTAMMTYKVLVELGYEHLIDKQAAEYFYTGMMTDTGNFSYNSNDPEIYEIINRFLILGIDKDRIYRDIFNTSPENIIRLNAHVLCNCMTVDYDLHCAFLTLNKADQETFGFKHGNDEGLVNKPLAIPGVYYSVFLREDPNHIHISARSKKGYNVSKLCETLGGGGHGNAAGAEYKEGNIDDAERRIREYLSNHITN